MWQSWDANLAVLTPESRFLLMGYSYHFRHLNRCCGPLSHRGQHQNKGVTCHTLEFPTKEASACDLLSSHWWRVGQWIGGRRARLWPSSLLTPPMTSCRSLGNSVSPKAPRLLWGSNKPKLQCRGYGAASKHLLWPQLTSLVRLRPERLHTFLSWHSKWHTIYTRRLWQLTCNNYYDTVLPYIADGTFHCLGGI